jgi:hypothetical protein
MPKMKLVISVMVIVGVVIFGEAVYAFTRPEKLSLTQGVVLIGIALVALVVLMVTLWIVWKGLTKK